MELSKIQQEIVNTNKPYVAVVAAAAAGKTRVLTERVRKMLKDGINPKDIAVITFTNLAAQELQERLADDYKPGIYIGTIHGLAAYFLRLNGVDVGEMADKKEFDEFFEILRAHPNYVRHIPHILLDEAQDTSPNEYEFIFDMIIPDTFFVVGDYRQAIYSFKGADPELFDKLIADPGVSVYSLNENYRNGDKILKFAKKVLGKKNSVDDSIPMRQGGIVWEGDATLSNLKNWIKETGEYKDWAVLCTTNKIIQEICGLLEANGIPTITFKQGEVTKDQLESNMNSNKVKVLTYHSAKGLEFPYVAAWKPKNWGGDETDRVNYVGATRAKDVLLWMKEKKKSKWF